MPTVKLTIEYNGLYFHGWQKQPGLRTIQSELEKAIQTVLRCKTGELVASGRTDAGVHAEAQVVSFKVSEQDYNQIELKRLRLGVSALMAQELSVLDAVWVDDGFNARIDAKAKTYRYTILHREVPPVLQYGRVWYYPRKLAIERMQKEANLLVGLHDFTSFRGSGCNAKSPIREVLSAELTFEQPLLVLRIRGRGFLKQMVRNIVGTLVDIGGGRLCCNDILELLEFRDRRRAGRTAPAYGLCLESVEY
jgi:tRNA pseudouridine38-40 synthase